MCPGRLLDHLNLLFATAHAATTAAPRRPKALAGWGDRDFCAYWRKIRFIRLTALPSEFTSKSVVQCRAKTRWLCRYCPFRTSFGRLPQNRRPDRGIFIKTSCIIIRIEARSWRPWRLLSPPLTLCRASKSSRKRAILWLRRASGSLRPALPLPQKRTSKLSQSIVAANWRVQWRAQFTVGVTTDWSWLTI